MDVQIEELNAAVRMADGQSMLSPRVVEAIVRMVMERMKEDKGHEGRAEGERKLNTSVTGRK